MRKGLFVILLSICLLICSCGQRSLDSSPDQILSDDTASSRNSSDNSDHKESPGDASVLPQQFIRENAGELQAEELRVDIPELNLKNQVIYDIGRGYSNRDKFDDYRKREIVVYIVSDDSDDFI